MQSVPRDEILLVTYEFPYGSSETFLDLEVIYLAKMFRRVWIMPSRCAWSRSWLKRHWLIRRSLPSNCEVVLPDRDLGRQFIFACWSVCRLLFAATWIDWREVSPLRQCAIQVRESIKAALFASSIRSFVASERLRIYCYSYWKSEATAGLALLRRSNLITGFVTRCHRFDLYDEALKVAYRPFHWFVTLLCDRIITVSQDGLDYLRLRGVPSNKLVLSRLGVECATKIACSSEDGVFRLASCSNLVPVKRVHIIAEALARVSVPFSWIHFGDGPERTRIEEVIRRFPVNGQAKLPGRITNAEVLAHYGRTPVDLFVNVSESEGVPVSIMEALSAGIPCAATDAGGSAEIVDDNCGVVLEREITPEQLAFLIERLARCRTNVDSRRRAARERALKYCDASGNYASFAALLSALVSVAAAEHD